MLTVHDLKRPVCVANLPVSAIEQPDFVLQRSESVTREPGLRGEGPQTVLQQWCDL
jgi:hypothetical protein